MTLILSRLLPATLFGLACTVLMGGGVASGQQAMKLSGDVMGTHDPSMAREHGVYYVFATGRAFPPRPPETAGSSQPPAPEGARPLPTGQLPIRCSSDLQHWTRCGQVFSAMPQWITESSPATKDLWAPDISFFNGKYYLYYCFSVFGKNTSGIALVTNETLDPASPRYKWVDQGLVVRSVTTDDFNAIDPNLVVDSTGEPWLSFGSFWTGLKMRHLDRMTGLLSKTDTKLYSLAARQVTVRSGDRPADLPPDTEAIEAPYIVHHGSFYYLFASWDLCCKGSKSTYKTVVGRSSQVTGPYLDRCDVPMLQGGGTVLLNGGPLWVGPGGESILLGPDLMVFHAYDASSGRPSLQISPITWDGGWPTVALDGGQAALPGGRHPCT